LQREARALSDRVKAFTEATTTAKPSAPAVPDDSAMRKWLENNPNDPRADSVRKLLSGGK
jgi:hypothetical protein